MGLPHSEAISKKHISKEDSDNQSEKQLVTMSTGNAEDSRRQRVDPRLVRFSQNSVYDKIFPDTPIEPWLDECPYTLPLNVISLPNSSEYLSYDNCRLYSAIESGLQYPDLTVDIVVHPHDEELSTPSFESTELAWISEEDVHILHIQAKTWFGAIVMRCFKQSSNFSLLGTTSLPVCESSRPSLPDQWMLKASFLQPKQLPLDQWPEAMNTLTSNTESVMVKMEVDLNVYHTRSDVPAFLHRHQEHFLALSFICQPKAFFESRMQAGADADGDVDYDDGEIDVLMAEIEDELEFDWVEQQMQGRLKNLTLR